MTVGEVCRKAGISDLTYYNRRKKYGGLMTSEMKPEFTRRAGPRLGQVQMLKGLYFQLDETWGSGQNLYRCSCEVFRHLDTKQNDGLED